MGNDLIAKIADWHSRHGRYPCTLAEASLASPTSYHGGFEYRWDGRGGFVSSIGVPDGVNPRQDYESHSKSSNCYD